MDFIEEMRKKKLNIEKSIEKERQMLKSPPDAQLSVTAARGDYSWRYTDSETGKRIYIPKKDRPKAEELAVKMYQRQVAKYDVTLYDAICAFDKIYGKGIPPEEYLENNPGMAELVLPHVRTLSKDLKEWEYKDYAKFDGHPEGLKIKTLKGVMVRSKSEMTIADALFRNSIPFRYECLLKTPSGLYAPDFTCVAVYQKKIIIWEHAGLIEKSDYSENFSEKINTYTSMGFRLGKELIVTVETADQPLDSEYVQYIIDHNFK